MAATPTPRLNLNKQTHADPNWHTALNAGFDLADARLVKISPDFGNAPDPNTFVAGDYLGQPYLYLGPNGPVPWYCTVVGNAATAEWTPITANGQIIVPALGGTTSLYTLLQSITPSPGTVWPVFQTVPNPGWIFMEDNSIGNIASGATNRANLDTINLFTLLWNQCSNTVCPVSSGRGASAAVDFSANKTLTLPRALGRALCSAGSGTGLTSRATGEWLGAEGSVMSITNLIQHDHDTILGNTTQNNAIMPMGGSNPGTGVSASGPAGASPPDPIGIVQPSQFVRRYMIKL